MIDIESKIDEQTESLKQELLSRDGTAAGQADPLAAEGLQWAGVGLRVDAGRKEILRGCFGHVRHGELLGIVGSSGSGKTSLLNLLAFRLEPTCAAAGRVSFDGREVKNRGAMKRLSSFVSQADCFHPNLTPRSRGS